MFFIHEFWGLHEGCLFTNFVNCAKVDCPRILGITRRLIVHEFWGLHEGCLFTNFGDYTKVDCPRILRIARIRLMTRINKLWGLEAEKLECKGSNRL